MNMRKIIAVLAAVLMLCAIIPMGVFAAPGDVILQGNFDDSNKIFSGNTTIEDGALHWDTSAASWAHLTKGITVAANTDYVVSFKMKSDMTHKVSVKFMLHDWSTQVAGQKVAPTADWTEYTVTLNSGANTSILFMIQASVEASVGQQIYIDDFSITEHAEPVTPEDPDMPANTIYSEDFEDGDLGGWTSSTSSVATDMTVSNGSSYALKFVSTNYSYTNYKLAVEKNTTYRVQYSLLSAEASRPLNVRIRTSGSVDLAYNQHAGSTTAWQTFTMVFNSGNETSLNFRFQSAHTTCTYYIDNLTVTPVNVNQKNDGFLKNGDFETGKADNWDYTPSSSYVADPTNSGQGYVLQTNEAEKVNMIAQPVNIVEGKEYVLYFKVYGYSTASNSAIFVRLGAPANTTWDTGAISTNLGNAGDVSDTWTRQVRLNMNSNTGKWCYAAVPFTAAKTAAINVAIYNYRPNEGKYYFDDFVVFEKKAASNDGYIINGDFETATTEGMKTGGQTTVSPSAAKDGNFGLHLKNKSGGWDGVGSWTMNNLEIGATYKLEMDMKAVANGLNWTLWNDEAKTTKYFSGYFNITNWTHIEKEFVATTTYGFLNINGGNAGSSEDVYLDNLKITKIKDAHTCEFVGTETQAPTCTEDGIMTYACSCGEGTYTEAIPALGHTAGAAADCENAQVCTVCGAELTAALGHSWDDATCTAPKTCSVCGATEGEALGHAYAESARVDATCGADGSVTYTCGNCGDSYTDTITATGEHKYENGVDVDCDVCGAIRETEILVSDGKSVSEDVSGLAFLFSVKASGTKIWDHTVTTYFENSASIEVEGQTYKLKWSGAVVSNVNGITAEELTITNAQNNGNKTIRNIGAKYLYDWDEVSQSYAIRVTNIPAAHYDTVISCRPYYVYENNGETITVYGDMVTGTYNQYAN